MLLALTQQNHDANPDAAESMVKTRAAPFACINPNVSCACAVCRPGGRSCNSLITNNSFSSTDRIMGPSVHSARRLEEFMVSGCGCFLPLIGPWAFSVWAELMVRVRGRVRVASCAAPSVFERNLQRQPVRGSEHPRGMPLVTHMQELQAEEQRSETQWHPRV
jgi:hypothetical protein